MGDQVRRLFTLVGIGVLGLLLGRGMLYGADLFYHLSPMRPMPDDRVSVMGWPQQDPVSAMVMTDADGATVNMVRGPEGHFSGRLKLAAKASGLVPVSVTVYGVTSQPKRYQWHVPVSEWRKEDEGVRGRIRDLLAEADALLAEKAALVMEKPVQPLQQKQKVLIGALICAYQEDIAQAVRQVTQRKNKREKTVLDAEQVFFPVLEADVLSGLQDYVSMLKAEIAWLQVFQDRPSGALPDIERWRLYALDMRYGRQDFVALWPTASVDSTLAHLGVSEKQSREMAKQGISALQEALQREDIAVDMARLSEAQRQERMRYQEMQQEREALADSINTLTEVLKKKISQYETSETP